MKPRKPTKPPPRPPLPTQALPDGLAISYVPPLRMFRVHIISVEDSLGFFRLRRAYTQSLPFVPCFTSARTGKACERFCQNERALSNRFRRRVLVGTVAEARTARDENHACRSNAR